MKKMNLSPPLSPFLWAKYLFILVLFSISMVSAAAQNLLTNPGFEGPYYTVTPQSPGVTSGLVANGWTDDAWWISGATVAYSQDTSVYHSGSSSQKIVVSTGYGDFEQYPTFQPGRYTASIWVKAQSPTWVTLALNGSAGNNTTYAAQNVRVGTTWQQITVNGLVPATPGAVLISVGEPGTVWLDDATLVYNGTSVTPITLTPPTTSIPITYFGQHPQHLSAVNNGTLMWPGINFGYARSHDGSPTWAAVEPANGTYNWTNMDAFVNQALASGQKIIYTFCETPQWATTDTNYDALGNMGGNGFPSNMSYWTSFVTALVNRYKGKIAVYEIWNEPNTEFWDGTPAQMAQMEAAAAPIIHSIDPSAKVASASYDIVNLAWCLSDEDQYFAAGGGSYSDIIAVHLYDPTPEDDINCVTAIKSLMAAYGYSSKPLWNTETGWGDTAQSGGWNDAPMSETVAYLARSYILEWVMGVSNYDWYAWNEVGNVGVGQNIVNGANTILKAGSTAYVQIVSWLNGATVTSCALDGNGNWVTQTMSPGGVHGWIIWNNDTTYNYPVPTGATTLTDMAGNVSSLSGVSTVAVNGTPIFITNAPPAVSVTTPVNLSPYFNRIGITNDSAPTLGNIDGSGASYSAHAIGSQSLNVNGVPFTLGSFTNSTNNVVSCTGQTLILPPGKYNTLYLLGCGAPNDQAYQWFTVYYTNGTSYTGTLNLSSWASNDYSNTIAKTMTYRNGPSGQINTNTNIYEVPLSLNSNSTVLSITLPPGAVGFNILAATVVAPGSPPASTTTISSSLNPSLSGNPVTFTATVTGSSPTGTVQFMIDGTNAGSPVTLSSGHATYSTSSLSTGTHTVIATYGGDAGNSGSTGTLSPSQVVNSNGVATTTAVSSSLNPSTYGGTVTFTATVTGSSPTGTVQFKIDGTNAGSPVALSSGHATYTTSALSGGTHTVTATYGGDANNQGSVGTLSPVQTVNKAASATALSSSLNPSTSGTAVTFTATVTGSSPTGTVQFAIDGSNVGSPVALSSGHATYATSTLSVATHTVAATYSGDANNNTSSGTLSPSQVVNTAPAGVLVNLSGYYNSIGITNDSAPSLGNIDGSGYSYSAQAIGGQSISVGSTAFNLGPFTNSANNVITCTGQTITLPSGHYSTLYLLGCGVNGSQSNQTFTVNYASGSPSNSSLTLNDWCSPAGNTVAKSMTYRNGPSGSVTFTNDIYEYAITLNSANTVSSLQLPSNSQVKILAAALIPTGSGLPGTTTTVSSSLNPSTYGASVTFTATVTGSSPTGTVQFAIDGTNAGSPVALSSGHATYATSSLSVATHTVTVTYSGDAGNAGSSGTLSPVQTVNKVSSSTAVSSSLNPSTSGTSVTFTATVTGNSPTGTVQFAIDGSNVGSPVTLSSGAATYATSTLSTGTHTVTAAYSGNTNNSTSSGTLSPSQVVNSSGSAASVNLTSYFNTVGITNDSATSYGNIDGSGYSYSAQAIGGQSFTAGSVPFTLGSFTNGTNNVITCSGQTITLPSGHYSALYLLGCGTNGAQSNQTFTVNYTSGSTNFNVGLSDWCNPGSDTVAKSMTYRNGSGGQATLTNDIYNYTLTLNSANTTSTLVLPSNGQVKILAATLVP